MEPIKNPEEVITDLKPFLTAQEPLEAIDVRSKAVDLIRLILNTPTAFTMTEADIDHKESSDPELWKQASLIVDLPVFQFVIDAICAEQVRFIACQSPGHESDMIGRGTINGASLVRERLELLATQFRQNFGEGAGGAKE